MSDLDEVAAALGQAFFVATVAAEGKPRVRPFGLAQPYNGHLWFITSSEKKVFKELEKNPFTEICAFNAANGEWWRVHGEAHIADDPDLRKLIFTNTPTLSALYQGPDDPVIRTFWIEGAADYYSFTASADTGPARSVPLT
jgi:uncharacterized pyridoxamine 5'-phosphate oxidase family protein